MFEHKSSPLLPRNIFLKRQILHFFYGFSIILFSLAIGAIGFELCEHRGWVDSIYSASMILTGMGPAFTPQTDTTKLFSSAYALFSGVVFLTTASIVLAPAAHRLIHKLHLDDDDLKNARKFL